MKKPHKVENAFFEVFKLNLSTKALRNMWGKMTASYSFVVKIQNRIGLVWGLCFIIWRDYNFINKILTWVVGVVWGCYASTHFSGWNRSCVASYAWKRASLGRTLVRNRYWRGHCPDPEAQPKEPRVPQGQLGLLDSTRNRSRHCTRTKHTHL